MEYEYDLAVSFAGEDREIVDDVINVLKERSEIKIFYDKLEQHNLWGKDLYQYLSQIYSEKSQYCLIFVSENYMNSNWPKHELKNAQARAFIQESEYILPIKLDDTTLPGINETTGYIDYREKSLHELVTLIIKKIPGAVNDLLNKDQILFLKITAIVNAFDPMNLFPFSPVNEYDIEVRAIINELESNQTQEDIKFIVIKIFTEMFFEGAIDIESADGIAYRIFNTLNGENNDFGYGL
ncbi:toll/interleukin-1 receptor domain-containing protein [Planomicrobium okeanokoites]|uniref:toll/interleukin-1 receptor domain-containing protein n=1 Tax=Planomicrobium okeanokoites TaxID=244 RepID=UPI00249225D7|nr:TIR domain-containing protein [Planomicrobium okeanokoites]